MSAVVADVFRAYRFVRLGRGPPSVRATLAGAVVASAAGLLVAGVGPSAVGVAAAGALVGGALVRVLPGVVAAAGRRGALVARLAVEAGLAGDGGLVARAAARRRVRRDLRRELAAELQRVADARELVAEYRAQLFEALDAGIRWVLHPPDGTSRTRDELETVAETLGVPVELVESIALDPLIPVDTPVAIGGHPDRFRGFETDLRLVRVAVESKRQLLDKAERQLQDAVAGLPGALAAEIGR